MKIPYFCCIGAELKRYAKDFDFMNQVYLYKVPADDTMAEVLAQDYFQAVADTVLQDDIVYIYEPTTEMLYTCHFNKQNGHITAEQMSNNIPSLTPDKILISDATGHITAGDVSLDFVKNKLTDLENNKVNIDGSSTMTGPLKFKAGSFSGAIAGGLGDGISIYKLKADGTIDSEVASLTKTNGFTPGTTNAQNIGSSTLKWKDLYIARVITAVLNNGADIGIPTTGGTMALTSDIKNSTVSVQLDGSAVDSFTLNQSSNKTINIPAANKDLSNLTNTGQNIANWSSNVTNCITEIPQDINITLENGTLTLKAGSKVYVPNSPGVFDTVTIANDVVYTYPDGAYKLGLYYDNNSNSLKAWVKTSETSGTTAPSGNGTFYNTTTNKISRYVGGSIQIDNLSFPIATITTNASQITSIDQVFNGFGYIGSTVFALPGVKGLIPDGRNEDGSLKSIEFTNTIVRAVNVSGTGSGSIVVAILGMGVNLYAYDEVKNAIFRTDTGTYYNADRFIVGNVSFSNSIITLFTPKQVFHAVDYSDTEYMAHQAMPSDRYINLTLGASGATYTAPADGWLFLNKIQGTANTRIEMYNQSSTQRTLCIGSSSTGQWIYGSMQAKKGDVIEVVYSVTGSTKAFKFIYAQGAE